jgi:hypothetical protein
MDPLCRDDIERARKATPAEKARIALEMMRFGTELKRDGLRARHPHESAEQIEERIRQWLLKR